MHLYGFALPPMGKWWQYASPMFPEKEHHAAARVIQSCMRCALYKRWSIHAKQCAAASIIGRNCRPWIRRLLYRKNIESIVKKHLAKRALHSRMHSLRNSRANRAKMCPGKQFNCTAFSKNKIKVPVGFCAFVVSCNSKLNARIGSDNDFVISVNPKKVRVLKLYSDMSHFVQDDFTLCINGVPLLPNLFQKKLNSIGVCPGEVYNISFI